ncbi:MAG: hypothetical protein DA330_02110 [Nitrososphaera sp.]|nr:hypothetical protein [Nitrososphaera sp.]
MVTEASPNEARKKQEEISGRAKYPERTSKSFIRNTKANPEIPRNERKFDYSSFFKGGKPTNASGRI